MAVGIGGVSVRQVVSELLQRYKMSYLGAKMHQISILAGARPRSGSSQRSPRTPRWI